MFHLFHDLGILNGKNADLALAQRPLASILFLKICSYPAKHGTNGTTPYFLFVINALRCSVKVEHFSNYGTAMEQSALAC
jgi:hypothetical protein